MKDQVKNLIGVKIVASKRERHPSPDLYRFKRFWVGCDEHKLSLSEKYREAELSVSRFFKALILVKLALHLRWYFTVYNSLSDISSSLVRESTFPINAALYKASQDCLSCNLLQVMIFPHMIHIFCGPFCIFLQSF